MAPPPEYDKEPKAPDKSATNISCEEMKTVHNLVNDQQHNSDNKSASTASNADVENNKLVETLDDGQLRALLDEAITYKCPKDREGKSSLFKELLEEVEQDEQATEAAARSLNTRGGSTRAARAGRSRRALPHSNSLQDLVAALAAEPAPRRHRPAPAPAPAPVSARAIHGGSLPSGVDTSFLLGEEPMGGGYLATVRCVNPPPLTERLSSDEADLARRSKQVFPMTYTARATLEIGSGAVSSGRAVTTTTASNQVRTFPRTARYHPRKPRHQPAQTQTYRIPPVNGNREPYMLNRNMPNTAQNYSIPPDSRPYANWQRPIGQYYRNPPTCGPPERIYVKKLYNPDRRSFVKHVHKRRVVTQKTINDLKSEEKQQYPFGGEIESNSDHNVEEKTGNVKPNSPKDYNTKSDKSLSSIDENIDSNQSKLLRGLVPKTSCDKNNGGGSRKKTTKENKPRGPKANTENKNTEDKMHKKNIEKPMKKEQILESDLWKTHVNNWYKNLGPSPQGGIAPFISNRPNKMTQNIYKGVNKHSYKTAEFNAGHKKTNRENEDSPWVLDDSRAQSYYSYSDNYYDYDLYQSEMKYRKRIGTGLVKRKMDLINPRNIRKMTIGKPLPDFLNITDNSSTNEHTTDKVKVNNNENKIPKSSKNIKETVSDVVKSSDSSKDFVASSDGTKVTTNYFEEDNKIGDETVNLSVRSSTPVNEANDSVYQVTEKTKLEKEVDDIDNTSEAIRSEDKSPPVENDQGTVHIPVVSQSDYIAIDDFCSFSQVKDGPCGEVVELTKMSSIPEENTIEQLDVFKNINSIVKFDSENCVELKDMSSQGVKEKHKEELLSMKSHHENNPFSRYLAEQQKLFQALENSGVVDDSIKKNVEQKHEEELLSISLKSHHDGNPFSRYLAEQQKLFQALENSGEVDNSIKKQGVEQKHEEEILRISLKSHLEGKSFSRYIFEQQKLFQALENSVTVDSIQKHSLVSRLDNSEKVYCAHDNECINEYVKDKIETDSLDNVPKKPLSYIVECSKSDTTEPSQVVIRLDESAMKNSNGENVPNEPTSSLVECSNSDMTGPSQEVVIRLDESTVKNANCEHVPNELTSSTVECSNSDTAAPPQGVVIRLDESAVENANSENVPNEPMRSIVECSNSDKTGPSQEVVIRLDELPEENANGENVPNEPTSSIIKCSNSDTTGPSKEAVIRLDESTVKNANGENVPNEPTSSIVECSNSDTAAPPQELINRLDESAVENTNVKNVPIEPTTPIVECSSSDTAAPPQRVVNRLDESAVENANTENVPNEPTSSILECSNSEMAGPSQKVVIRLNDPALEDEYCDEYILAEFPYNDYVFLTLPQHLLGAVENVPNKPTISIVEHSNSDTARTSQEVVIRLDESAVENANSENVANEPTSSIVKCSNSDTTGPSQEVVIRLDVSVEENANGENVPNEPTSSIVKCSNSDTTGPSKEGVIRLDESAVENANGENVPNEPTSSIVECSNSDTTGSSQEVVIRLDESSVKNANCENVPNEPTSSIVECSNSDTVAPPQGVVNRLDESAVESANGENVPNEPTSSTVEYSNSNTTASPKGLVNRLDESDAENANGENVPNEPTSSIVECSNSDMAEPSQKVVIRLNDPALEEEYCDEYILADFSYNDYVFLTLPQHLLGDGENVLNGPTISIVEHSNSDTAGPSQEVIRLDESAVENANSENVPNEPTSSIVKRSNSDTTRPSEEVVKRLDDSAVENANGENVPNEPTSSIVECSNSDTAGPPQGIVIGSDESAVENANCENFPSQPTRSIVKCSNSDTTGPSQEIVIRLDELAEENANGENVLNGPTISIVEHSNSDTAEPSQEVVIRLDESAVENANIENVPNEPTSTIVERSKSDTAAPPQGVVIRLDESAVENANIENVPNEPTSSLVECSNSDTAAPPQGVVIRLDESAVEYANSENVPNEPTRSIVECSNSDMTGPSQEVVIRLDESAVENANGENVPNEPTSSIGECSNSDMTGPSQEVVIRLDESAVENANGENVPNEPTSSIGECSNSDMSRPSQEVEIRLDESAVENAIGENVPNEPTSSIVECSNSDMAGPPQGVVIRLDESAEENANGENIPNELTSSKVNSSSSGTAGHSQEVVIRLNDPAVEDEYCDQYVLAELPYNAYVFLTLPQHLLSHINCNENTLQLQIENTNKSDISGGNSTKEKKKKISLENAKNREVTNKNALRTLLFENVSKSDSADKSVRKGTSTISKTEVDSAIPFSCITTPEVVTSCNTTASTTQSAVAVDPKPLQLESSYRAVSSLTGELLPDLPPALTPAPPPAAPALAQRSIVQDQPRSVISSTFNGLPLSRPNYGSTATTTQDEYKKSIDENGNSVQGFSSPLSGSSQHKKPRRKKSSKNETVIKSHQIDGYQGNKDLNEVLRFIESNAESTRAGKLGRTKHKDDADDKAGKKRSTERRKDKENKMKRATSMEELSRTTLEDLTDKPAKKERWPDGAAPKAERRSWGDDARDSFYYHEPEPDADFQTVTKKRKPRRRPDDAAEPPEAAAGDPPRQHRAPEPRARRVSAPPSDRSNDSNDDMDSVHSLPADAPRAPTHAPVSYADIARTRHNIPDLIESCNFYAEGEGEGGEVRIVLQGAGGGYPALEPRAPRRAPPARELKPGAPPAATNIRPHRKERAESGSGVEPAVTVVEEATVGLEAEGGGEWPAPDVLGDRRPAVILLDSAQRAPDMDGVTFGFDINEQLLGGPTRRPRCDLVRDAIEGGTVPVAETNGAAIDGVTDAADIVIGDATMGVTALGPALGAVTQTALGVAVGAGCAALRYVPPRPPPDTHHLHQIIDYVGAAWEDVLRCGGGKVRYFSE